MVADGSRLQFEPIRQLRAHDYVAEQIERHIALRLIRPGDALPPERELAAMFGVGRPTIQHALRLLEARYLIEARPGRGGGTFVLEPSADEGVMEELIARIRRQREQLGELLDYRRVIEPATARLAATARRKSELAAIRAANEAMAAAADEADFMRHDTEFHLAIARASRNRYLVAQSDDVRARLSDAISLLPETDGWHAHMAAEHAAVLAAIDAGDADAAAAAMDVHVASSEQALRAVLTAVGRRRLPRT